MAKLLKAVLIGFALGLVLTIFTRMPMLADRPENAVLHAGRESVAGEGAALRHVEREQGPMLRAHRQWGYWPRPLA